MGSKLSYSDVSNVCLNGSTLPNHKTYFPELKGKGRKEEIIMLGRRIPSSSPMTLRQRSYLCCLSLSSDRRQEINSKKILVFIKSNVTPPHLYQFNIVLRYRDDGLRIRCAGEGPGGCPWSPSLSYEKNGGKETRNSLRACPPFSEEKLCCQNGTRPSRVTPQFPVSLLSFFST